MIQTVLVVDDSEVTLAILSRTLRGAGYEVLQARDGAEAAIQVLRSRPAVVITDLEMPTMHGYSLLRLLKADPASAHIPVLVLSSQRQAASRFWSLRTGADAYLTKDYRPQDLIETVAQLAARGAPAEAGLAEAGLATPPPQAINPITVLSRVARHLDDALLQATLVNTLLEQGVAASDFHEAARGALETLGEILDTVLLAVAVADPEVVLTQTHLTQAVRQEDVEIFGRRLIERVRPRSGLAVEARVSGTRGDLPLADDGAVWLPLPLRGAAGVLAVVPQDAPDFDVSSRQLLDSLVGPLALGLDNARLSHRLHELSTLDGLTRQLNHRAIHERLTEELERARRYKHPLSVVLCDFDFFKQINDTHGHLIGDAVLREGAVILRHCLRNTDLLGRYGGEEFLMVLPQVDLTAARLAAERLRQSLAAAPVRISDDLEVQVTGSFGVADRDELSGPVTADLLVSLADRRLYEAKDAGRNCIRP
jgi:two-component system cell cycle response regulator